MSTPKICVVGAGAWGKNHVRTLQSLNSLGGVVDQSESVRKELKKQYQECAYFERVEDALQHKFDGYTVATLPEDHFVTAVKIIDAGHHVMLEKPMTLNSTHAEKLNTLAKEKNVNLMVGHLLLFHPAFKKIKQLVNDKRLGELQYLYTNRLNLGTIRTEENVFWSFAPHDIALFQFFTGSMPVRITSRGIDALQDGIHDTTITAFEYPDGVMGHIFVSWLHPFKEHRFVVVGSEGMVRFEDSVEGKPLVFYDKKVDLSKGKPLPLSGPTRHIEYEQKLALTAELEYFIDHLNGDPIEIANGDSAVDVIQTLERATLSLMEQ